MVKAVRRDHLSIQPQREDNGVDPVEIPYGWLNPLSTIRLEDANTAVKKLRSRSVR
jgi:hypothetical protein